ncbi:hypothetical protein OE88DRAFT_1743465 [Heliocybe sulcata]|uniref:RAVE complex protein Rav1 C-terminal domain-containing protein n=1 Tax=Heliocybe sulcata TaxID=5364 RepID=A0A5C3NGD5_9AGAM|nr:hypothetical protein OE88DRAFT_1743465 [Heliocybe sulcata]
MMNLLQAYTGCPETGIQHLILPLETLLLYPLGDSVILLDARTLRLVRALAFWEAFPRTLHLRETVKCISVDSSMKLVIAAMGSRIAAWSMSGAQSGVWRVHSTLLLSEDQEVTALDCKSGLLAVGSLSHLSVYTLILENDLPTWSHKWRVPFSTPARVRFSPSLMYFATTSLYDNSVRIYLTTSGRQTQGFPHPRAVADIRWRDASQASSRDDLVLYTITVDSVLRIFLPVIDAPQHLQLHASIDLFSSVPFSVAAKSDLNLTSSSIFWLDRTVVSTALAEIFKRTGKDEDGRLRRLRDIKDEGWDLFLRVLGDGSAVVSGVANIDTRPPTLLKQFTLLQSQPGYLPRTTSHFYVVPNPGKTTLTLVTAPPLATYNLLLPEFFEAKSEGLKPIRMGPEPLEGEASRILRFIRTPEGKGVAVLREDVGQMFSVSGESMLVRQAAWRATDHSVVLVQGRLYATYSAAEQVLTLHSKPPATVSLPLISSLFVVPSDTGESSIVAIATDSSVFHIHVSYSPHPSLIMHSHSSLPLSSSLSMIIPVDPMAWSGRHGSAGKAGHDVLLSIDDKGELAFWVFDEGDKSMGWRCTGNVRTGRTGIRMARCSSAKKSALVVPGPEGEELTIWDSKESEFSSGLEYRQVLKIAEPVNDLDWTSTPDSQSVLAVGFSHSIEVLCQQRMSYFDEEPRWDRCWKIELSDTIPHGIADSIWLANGTLLVGAGHHMLVYGQPQYNDRQDDAAESLFQYVARLNGPLVEYHPQMLLQCLLWGKLELVKDIIVNLARFLRQGGEDIRPNFHNYKGLPLEAFLHEDHSEHVKKTQYSSLFEMPDTTPEPQESDFNRNLVENLVEDLRTYPPPHFTPNEQAHLAVMIQTTLEVEEQRRALDGNALRYLAMMRSFHILNRLASEPNSPQAAGAVPRKSGSRQRLRYRDMIWAFHSESQDLMLSASMNACHGKMTWKEARAMGVFIWLTSTETMRSHMEVIARNQYLAGDNRDPTACSLFYFALGKVKLVHGLWRTAAWHPEQGLMLKFLSNDFNQPRWRTAALKNGYALLAKQRFQYAAAFFLLGGSLKDAVNVCIKQLSDFQLAVALARVVEQGDNGAVLRGILENTVVPLAFKDGNRWLGSWAFWLLHRRDLAVRILIAPLADLAVHLNQLVTEIGDPHYDDPSLALLFSQLKLKTLQTAKGTSEISGQTEFNFVLQIARVFCRLGKHCCHVLALNLVRTWSFARPSTAVHEDLPGERALPPSPTTSRRSFFPLEPALRRTSSIMIDMDISSGAPTRSASPERRNGNAIPEKEEITEEPDLLARKAGLGNLMKSAKKDVKVPEFDMNAFGF